MTKVRIYSTADGHAIEVKGHAGYAEFGKDIVCASIVTVCNFCTAFLGDNATIETGDGYFRAEFGADAMYEQLLEAAVQCFEALAERFPKNVEIEGRNNLAYVIK